MRREQDDIFGTLRGVRLSESSHVEPGRQDQHRGCDQSGSVHSREFHFYLLVKLTVAIKPEQPWPRNWTMVSPTLLHSLSQGFRTLDVTRNSIKFWRRQVIVNYRDKRTRDFAVGKRVKAFSSFERAARLKLDRMEAATR